MPALLHSSSFHVSEKKPRSSEKRWGRISSTPAIPNSHTLSIVQLRHAPHQITGIFRIAEPLSAINDFSGREVAELKRDLFEAHDLEALPSFDGAHKRRGIVEALVGARIQPRKAAAKLNNAEIAAFEICAIDVADLQLATSRGR